MSSVTEKKLFDSEKPVESIVTFTNGHLRLSPEKKRAFFSELEEFFTDKAYNDGKVKVPGELYDRFTKIDLPLLGQILKQLKDNNPVFRYSQLFANIEKVTEIAAYSVPNFQVATTSYHHKPHWGWVDFVIIKDTCIDPYKGVNPAVLYAFQRFQEILAKGEPIHVVDLPHESLIHLWLWAMDDNAKKNTPLKLYLANLYYDFLIHGEFSEVLDFSAILQGFNDSQIKKIVEAFSFRSDEGPKFQWERPKLESSTASKRWDEKQPVRSLERFTNRCCTLSIEEQHQFFYKIDEFFSLSAYHQMTLEIPEEDKERFTNIDIPFLLDTFPSCTPEEKDRLIDTIQTVTKIKFVALRKKDQLVRTLLAYGDEETPQRNQECWTREGQDPLNVVQKPLDRIPASPLDAKAIVSHLAFAVRVCNEPLKERITPELTKRFNNGEQKAISTAIAPYLADATMRNTLKQLGICYLTPEASQLDEESQYQVFAFNMEHATDKLRKKCLKEVLEGEISQPRLPIEGEKPQSKIFQRFRPHASARVNEMINAYMIKRINRLVPKEWIEDYLWKTTIKEFFEQSGNKARGEWLFKALHLKPVIQLLTDARLLELRDHFFSEEAKKSPNVKARIVMEEFRTHFPAFTTPTSGYLNRHSYAIERAIEALVYKQCGPEKNIDLYQIGKSESLDENARETVRQCLQSPEMAAWLEANTHLITREDLLGGFEEAYAAQTNMNDIVNKICKGDQVYWDNFYRRVIKTALEEPNKMDQNWLSLIAQESGADSLKQAAKIVALIANPEVIALLDKHEGTKKLRSLMHHYFSEVCPKNRKISTDLAEELFIQFNYEFSNTVEIKNAIAKFLYLCLIEAIPYISLHGLADKYDNQDEISFFLSDPRVMQLIKERLPTVPDKKLKISKFAEMQSLRSIMFEKGLDIPKQKFLVYTLSEVKYYVTRPGDDRSSEEWDRYEGGFFYRLPEKAKGLDQAAMDQFLKEEQVVQFFAGNATLESARKKLLAFFYSQIPFVTWVVSGM